MLGIGCALWYFASGNNSIGVLAWIFPFFILQFLHSVGKVKGFLWLFVINYAVQAVAWKGMVPIPGIGYYLMVVPIVLLFNLPFLIDRWSRTSVKGFTATLILPFAAVAVDFINSSFSPNGTNGMLAYSQYGFPWLLQIMSVTGIWGISFLIYWPSSLVYSLISEPRRISARSLIVPSALYLFVFTYGAIRYSAKSRGEEIRAVSFTLPVDRTFTKLGELGIDLTHEAPLGEEGRSVLRQHQEAFFRMADSVIAADRAAIISSSEANLVLQKSQEPTMMKRMARFSRSRSIYSFFGAVVYERGNSLSENRLYIFSPNGEHMGTFDKAFIVPGDTNGRSDGSTAIFDTRFGTVGATICFDMDFPRFISKYGRERIDMMVSPASDWEAVSPYHTRLAMFRAIENGFSLLRQTDKGLSVAMDGKGRIYNKLDYYGADHTGGVAMLSSMPISNVFSIYPFTYDAFAFLCTVSHVFIVAPRKVMYSVKGPFVPARSAGGEHRP